MKIRITRGAVGLIAVAVFAYVAGNLHLLSAGEGGAWVQAKEPAAQPQVDPKMEAYMKAGTPGPNHRYLDVLAGDWAVEWKVTMVPGQPPMVSQGTVKRSWVLDGRWLQETVDATMPMGTLNGIGYMGYSNIDGQVEVVWMDNMSTGMMFETGTYNPQTKVLSTRSTSRDPQTGRVVYSWGKMDLSNPDRQVYTGYTTDDDGKEYKNIEGVATRR